MSDAALFLADLAVAAPHVPRGIHSQTLYDGPDLRLVLFAFAPGEELSEHTAARPAVVHVLDGEGDAVVGGTPTRSLPARGSGCPPGCPTRSAPGRRCASPSTCCPPRAEPPAAEPTRGCAGRGIPPDRARPAGRIRDLRHV